MPQMKSSNMKKRHNHWKSFLLIVGSCECFWSFGENRSMSAKSAIEKLQKIAKEKDVQKSEHKRRQEEEAELLKRKEVRKDSQKVKHEGMLNI